jgi:hypothetical protein
MKIQALMIAVALATGSAFAAGTAADSAQPTQKKAVKKAVKKKAATQAMGAGPASPVTDLQAASRQARIDQAYANWQSQQR